MCKCFLSSLQDETAMRFSAWHAFLSLCSFLDNFEIWSSSHPTYTRIVEWNKHIISYRVPKKDNSSYCFFSVSFQKVQHVFHVSVGRIMFEAWHKHTLEARKQREYFEVRQNSCSPCLLFDLYPHSIMISLIFFIGQLVEF